MGFVTVSRSRTGKLPLTDLAGLQAEVRQLLQPFFDDRENPKGKNIRLIGVRVEKLSRAGAVDESQERLLFEEPGNHPTMEDDL
jgi:hypothetical protein